MARRAEGENPRGARPPGHSVMSDVPLGTPYAIAVGRFYTELAERLIAGAQRAFTEAGHEPADVFEVPGAFELPLAAMALAKTRRYSCVIALGAVIPGETPHFDYVASEAASGLQLAGIETGVPVAFGLLTTDTV